tara:strand:- start:21673 stop:22917 length:1245 start_codon:yes stop_codon:yes gene_type:complete
LLKLNLEQIKVSKNWLLSFILSSALLLFLISESLLAAENTLSIWPKLAGGLFLFICIILANKINRAFLFILLPLLLIFVYNFFISYNEKAATEALIRFIVPMLIVLALMKVQNLNSLIRFFLFLTISNDLYQIYAYLAFALGLPTLLDARLEAGYIIRAEGWVGFFSLFGFMNFCAFVCTAHTDIVKNKVLKKLLTKWFLLFTLLSTSVKAVAALAIYLMVIARNSKLKVAATIVSVAIPLALIVPKNISEDLFLTLDSKVAFYLTVGNSARYESYRVMIESLSKPNVFGEGLGSFGGPASTKYNSPSYDEYDFNWYGLEGLLSTTDTMYPHIFVELGLLGGLLYLGFLFLYGQRYPSALWVVIVGAFIIDNFASFAMLSPPYFFTAALFMSLFSRQVLQKGPRTGVLCVAKNG